MTNSFKHKLGQGSYWNLYKGKLEDGSLVAVRALNLSTCKGNAEDFINEAVSISRTSHVNIVSLLGYCFERDRRALVFEFMPNGSLEEFNQKDNALKTGQPLGWEKLYRIAVGIARGLGYLHHGCTTRILHFDIKPHNILLDEDFCPKISDFGLAKICSGKGSVVSLLDTRGTIGYIAPEVYSRNLGGVAHKSDVYSYGMVMLEMVGGRKNSNFTGDNSSDIYYPHWVYKRLQQGESLGLQSVISNNDNEIAKSMVLVGLRCIQANPSQRPSMNEVLLMFEGSLETLKMPPKPFLYSPTSPLKPSLQYHDM